MWQIIVWATGTAHNARCCCALCEALHAYQWTAYINSSGCERTLEHRHTLAKGGLGSCNKAGGEIFWRWAINVMYCLLSTFGLFMCPPTHVHWSAHTMISYYCIVQIKYIVPCIDEMYVCATEIHWLYTCPSLWFSPSNAYRASSRMCVDIIPQKCWCQKLFSDQLWMHCIHSWSFALLWISTASVHTLYNTGYLLYMVIIMYQVYIHVRMKPQLVSWNTLCWFVVKENASPCSSHIWSYRTECGCHIRFHHAIWCPPQDQVSLPYLVPDQLCMATTLGPEPNVASVQLTDILCCTHSFLICNKSETW